MMGRLRSESGFTLVELLSAIAMSGIILSTAGAVVVSSVKITNTVGERTGSQQTGRAAADQIAQRLRSLTCLFPGEYAYNGSGTAATIRASSILHASANRFVYIGDVSNTGGTTGATGSVGFRPQMRQFAFNGTPGVTGSATLVEGWTNATTTTRPFNFNISPAANFDALATTSGVANFTPANIRAMADKVQFAPGYNRVFTYYNDADQVIAESSGAVPVASLELITKIRVAYRIAGKDTNLVTSGESSHFINDYYIRTITDRCEGA